MATDDGRYIQCPYMVGYNYTQWCDFTRVALAAAVGAGVYESLSQAGTALSPAEESKPRTEFIELYNDRFQMFTGLYHRVKDLY